MKHLGFYYFAHPYTCKDQNGNYCLPAENAQFNICNQRAGKLMMAGYNIFSPISHSHPIHLATPAFLSGEVHGQWYDWDNEFIQKCNFDGIILAPGWEKSIGCVAEKKLFESQGKRVLYYAQALTYSAAIGELGDE